MGNPPEKSAQQKRSLGLVVLLLLGVHVLLSAIAFWGPPSLVYSNPITSRYRQLVVIGPFFRTSAIQTSAHLAVRFKTAGTWSAFKDYSGEALLEYNRHPWRYDKLKLMDYEHYLLRSIGKINNRQLTPAAAASRVFQELNQLVLQEYIQQPIDSIELVNTQATYQPETNTHLRDTIFMHRYNPNAVARPKN
ncbi:hypothetical protein [Chryseolinea lacunae]|uniref:Uncharacterized protein n=1 Tax=Chryseolinea lacunae TaxID=2801331 RepID=A0ABS1KWC1_9BACT|nr:hypothetical protein [Chryseolinea lacunae]MBL0743659.1 hypothetical protein [Chryseolinea lacunae]